MRHDTQAATLTDFLLARIAEDEAVARAAQPQWDDDGWRMEWEDLPDESFRHARRLSPARVLAQCNVWRRIVEHCDVDHLTLSPGDPYVLQLLALPYADHPDYRDEWKP